MKNARVWVKSENGEWYAIPVDYVGLPPTPITVGNDGPSFPPSVMAPLMWLGYWLAFGAIRRTMEDQFVGAILRAYTPVHAYKENEYCKYWFSES
jgi:hypothetical protein